MSNKPVLITAALPYANGPLHIGHLAGAYLPADLFARYNRLRERDVFFVCGSDEHGVPIMLRAREEGVSPQGIVDRYHKQIKATFTDIGVSFDHYGRTSAQVHHAFSRDFFEALLPILDKKEEEQLFDPEAGLFLADRFIHGTCPVCGYEEAYGDQCEKCGSALSPRELLNPRSALTGATPELRATTHWYLPLDKLQPRLTEWLAQHPEWKSNVRGQIQSWLAQGLAPRAVTRDLPWGVPVPDEEGKVLYVWFDAPLGYVSASIEWAEQQGTPDAWKAYWQGGKLYHFIGKDNIVFHCLMFPAMLMAHRDATGTDWSLPENVPANEFLNLEGDKLSTSRNWAVWVHEAIQAFPVDVLRYALCATLPEQKDADFSWDDFKDRVNADLADTLGNFVHRTLTFTHRFADGAVPALTDPHPEEIALLEQLAEFPARIASAYESFRFREAVQEIIALARLGNKYFNDAEPWKTRTTDPERMHGTLHVCLQICASLSVLADPVLPFSMQRLREMLRIDRGPWEHTPLMKAGHQIGEAEILFVKIEDEQVEEQRALLQQRALKPEGTAPEEKPYPPVGETITFDDFAKLDLRLGLVTLAERIPKADKLLRLEIDLGFETRQILAGIAEQYAPEDIQGKKVVIVANLASRKMRGLESQGMVLMAEDRDGRMMPVGAESEPGAIVR